MGDLSLTLSVAFSCCRERTVIQAQFLVIVVTAAMAP